VFLSRPCFIFLNVSVNIDCVLPCVGDELLSDSFRYKEIENGMLWEVEGKVS